MQKIAPLVAAAALVVLGVLPGTARALDLPDAPQPLDPCPLETGEVALTRSGLNDSPDVPALLEETTQTWVVDLAGEQSGTSAAVGVTLAWRLRVDNFDLTVGSDAGAATSAAGQPDAEASEHVALSPLGHCSRLTVTITNTLAPLGQGLALIGDLDPADHTTPPALTDGLPLGGVPATAGVIVAPPAGATTGFANPVAIITQGGSLTLVGADTAGHNVACKDRDANRKPLCGSPFALAGETVPVNGVENLPPGEYALICQLHPNMTATLTIVGDGRWS